MSEEKENCNFQQNYNVFGIDDKPCCYLYHKYCDEIDSCYFKRCKRLEQENENLKKEVKQIGSAFIKKGDYARELEKENKELKELNKKICEDWEKEIKVYWNALEEIRKKCNWVKECSVTNDNLWEYDEILEIINEVLDDEEL